MNDQTQHDGCFWQGAKVRLRARRKDDWKREVAWLNDTETQRVLDYTVSLPPSEDSDEYQGKQPAGRVLWSIETLEHDLVGTIALALLTTRMGLFTSR